MAANEPVQALGRLKRDCEHLDLEHYVCELAMKGRRVQRGRECRGCITALHRLWSEAYVNGDVR
jgi:hypothetical protein